MVFGFWNTSSHLSNQKRSVIGVYLDGKNEGIWLGWLICHGFATMRAGL
jgi:hypothetical protein